MTKPGKKGKKRKPEIPARRGPGISESKLVHRLAEEARGSEERYRLLFEKNPEPMWVFDENTLAFLAVNDMAIRTYGYSAEEFLSMTLKEIRPPEDVARLLETVPTTRAGYAEISDVRHRKKDGSLIDVEIAAQPLEFSGRWARLVLARNVTERKRAEESIQKLLLAVEQAQDAIFMTDPDGAITYVNPTFERVYGYSSEEALGKTPRILKSGRHDQVFYERFWQRLVAGESTREEFVNKRRDGQLVIVEASVSPVLDAQGKRVGFIAVQADITERRRAEESFWESEQRYLSLFESMLHGYAHCEMLFENGEPRDFVYLGVNRAFEELTGLKGVVGKKVTEVIPGIRESNPELFEIYGRVALTGIPERFETYLDALGSWFSLSAFSLRKGHFVALFDNITERKRAEKEIRKSEERFRRLFDSNTIGITVANLSGEILESNDAYLAMVGYTREDLLSGGVRWDAMTPAEDREKDQIAVEQLQRTGVAQPYEKALIRKDGTHVPLLIGIATLEASESSIIAYTIDLSDRRLLEDQFRQAQKMEAIGQLAGGVAHDFNNLLTAILGYGNLLATRLASDDSGRSEVEEILRAAERAAALTRQLLAFSRQQVLKPVVLSINELIANFEKMLGRLIGEDVNLIARMDPFLGNVRADRGQLEQVIMNLAVNARDAMPNGGELTIETANADVDESYAQRHVPIQPGRFVMVAVSDTGSGMDAETQARIFEPFFTTKERGKGTGLGLSTVYGIVKQSGGYIWVYSEPGKGTTFKVYLPRVEETTAESVPPPADLPPRVGTETILLVEDEESVRTLTRRILEKHGYRVLEAANGSEAEKIVTGKPERIDVLLTDLVMPDMPGTELASRVQGKHPTIRVLFMSGYTDDAVVRNGLLGPGRAFLQKPFTPTMLVQKIRDILA